MHSILNSAFYVYVLGGIDMTIPELEQYLSSIFPHVEKPVFLPLGGAADESLLTNLSNSSRDISTPEMGLGQNIQGKWHSIFTVCIKSPCKGKSKRNSQAR